MSESIQVGFGRRQRQLKVLRYLTDFYSGGPWWGCPRTKKRSELLSNRVLEASCMKGDVSI